MIIFYSLCSTESNFICFFFQNLLKGLTLSWRRPMSYRNQSIDLLRNSVDWFLYDIGLRHERVNKNNKPVSEVIVSMIAFSQHTTLDNQHDQTFFDKNVIIERMPLERVSSTIRLLRRLLDWKKMQFPLASRYYKIIVLFQLNSYSLSKNVLI